jgi:hypothetical protein
MTQAGTAEACLRFFNNLIFRGADLCAAIKIQASLALFK